VREAGAGRRCCDNTNAAMSHASSMLSRVSR
jgi:hypothetical protein